jgi:hypothetical protein
MIDWVESILAGAIADRAATFVFPSQAAADSWARRAPSLFALKAVETDRFVGWDRFKEDLLSLRRAERPADRVSRAIWAASTMARQTEKPFLRRLLGPFPPSPAFSGFLARIPPSLAAIPAPAESADDEMLEDLELLRKDYAAFLADKGLFEPSWEKLPRPQAGLHYIIIAPELMEDFDRYAAALDGAPGIELRRMPRLSAPELYKFPNVFEELRWAFLEIAALLDGGTRPEDIALTLPALDEAAPHALAAAARAGVGVALREGELLSASPYGRLLRAMSECARSSFAFEETKALLLDRFASWKGGMREAARDLVRFGIERHAFAPYVDAGRRVDAWEESFELCGSNAELDLRGFYRRLKKAVLAVTGAKTFRALEAAIVTFRETFLDESSWDEGELKRVQRAMVELGSLVRAEEELDCAGRIPDPFGLFLRGLGELRYVPRNSEPAVSIYPYRVSALVAARHHFVLGCSQDGTAVRYAIATYLREDQKAKLGLVDRDASDDFAAAYALDSSARFSYAEEGIGGWSAPSPFFLGAAERAKPGAPPDFAEILERDPLRAEAEAWRSGSPLPRALLGFQKAAAASAEASLGDKGSDYGRRETRADAAAREAVLGARRTQKALLRLSATQLEEYLACPFAWLLARGLGLEEEPSGLGFFDARLAGEMAHAAVGKLFAEIAESGPFSSARLELYLSFVHPAVASVLPEFARKEGPFLVPMFSAYAPLLEDRLARLVAAESWMEGWETGDFERNFEKEYLERGIVLQGRVDRVARRGDDIALIDYKKRVLPRKSDIMAEPSSGGSLAKLQIAAYVALCESGLGRVERAAYWSIEDARRLVVIGPDGLKSREGYEAELAAFRLALAAVANGLAAGDFTLAQAEADSCGECGWASVCRCRYATE